jgi:hypothetical protein
MKRIAVVCLATTWLIAPLLTCQSAEPRKPLVDLSKIPQAADKKGVTFASDIKPIFEKSCVRCHGAEKPKGKLRLDNLESALKGGEGGKVVQPGHGTESVLLHKVARVGDPDAYMPPPNNRAGIPPLPNEQIGLIRAWIDQGAK